MKFYQLAMDCEKCNKELVIMKVFINAEDVWQFDCLCPRCGLNISWTSLSSQERTQICKDLDKKNQKALSGKTEVSPDEAKIKEEDKKFLLDFGISDEEDKR